MRWCLLAMVLVPSVAFADKHKKPPKKKPPVDMTEPAAEPTPAPTPEPEPPPTPPVAADATPPPAEPAPAPVATPAVAPAPKPADKPPEEDKRKLFELSGYLQPAFSVVHRADAVPRDRLKYGAEATRAGVILEGAPIKWAKYNLEVVVAGETNDLVTKVDTVDSNGDGMPDDVAPTTERLPGVFVERAVIEIEAGYGFSLVAGQHRIPFTVQEQSPSTQLMFPSRSGPNEVFVQGPDLGLEVVYHAPEDRAIAQVGGFNGTGEPVEVSTVHGVTYSARIDINPLGEFPVAEAANTKPGPLRLGFGAGILYYSSRHYDMAGFPGAEERDLRAAASVRVAISGLYVQSEVLRRQRTDSLSNRPDITTGAYVQASWYQPALIGFAPLARFGWAAEDEGFAPRTTLWLEGGVALYPKVSDPDALRIIVEYLGERRVTEAEQANGAIVQAQLVW